VNKYQHKTLEDALKTLFALGQHNAVKIIEDLMRASPSSGGGNEPDPPE